jgi:hypothetical protein
MELLEALRYLLAGQSHGLTPAVLLAVVVAAEQVAALMMCLTAQLMTFLALVVVAADKVILEALEVLRLLALAVVVTALMEMLVQALRAAVAERAEPLQMGVELLLVKLAAMVEH